MDKGTELSYRQQKIQAYLTSHDAENAWAEFQRLLNFSLVEIQGTNWPTFFEQARQLVLLYLQIKPIQFSEIRKIQQMLSNHRNKLTDKQWADFCRQFGDIWSALNQNEETDQEAIYYYHEALVYYEHMHEVDSQASNNLKKQYEALRVQLTCLESQRYVRELCQLFPVRISDEKQRWPVAQELSDYFRYQTESETILCQWLNNIQLTTLRLRELTQTQSIELIYQNLQPLFEYYWELLVTNFKRAAGMPVEIWQPTYETMQKNLLKMIKLLEQDKQHIHIDQLYIKLNMGFSAFDENITRKSTDTAKTILLRQLFHNVFHEFDKIRDIARDQKPSSNTSPALENTDSADLNTATSLSLAYRKQQYAVQQTFSHATQPVYTQNIINLIDSLIKAISERLLTPPCAFSILAVGSLACDLLTPSSDADIYILVTEEKYRNHQYFKILIRLLQFHLLAGNNPWFARENGREYRGLCIDIKQYAAFIADTQGSASFYIQTSAELVHNMLTACPNQRYEQTYALLQTVKLFDSDPEKSLYQQFQVQLQSALTPPIKKALAQNYLKLHRDHFTICLNQIDTFSIFDVKTCILQPMQFWLSTIALFVDEKFNITNNTLSQQLTIISEKKSIGKEFLKQFKIVYERMRLFVLQLRQTSRFDMVHRWSVQAVSQSKNNLQDRKSCGFAPHLFHALNETEHREITTALYSVLIPAYQSLNTLIENGTLAEAFDPPHELFQRTLAAYQANQDKTHEDDLTQASDCLLISFDYRRAQYPTYIAYYRLLIEDYRPIFLKRFENPLWPTELTLKEREQIQTALNREPNQNGMRPCLVQQRNKFETQLRLLFTLESSPEHIQAAKNRNEWTVTCYHPTQGTQTYLLRDNIKPYLFDQQGNFLPKTAGHLFGRHTVLPTTTPLGILHAKLYPEQPPIASAIADLSGLLVGGGTPQDEIYRFARGHEILGHAVQFFSDAGKDSLAKVIKEYPERLNQITCSSFTRALLRVLLINPEDDHERDYFLIATEQGYELVRTDNERAFYPVEENEQFLLWGVRKILLIKSVILCLDQMTDLLDAETLAEIALLNPQLLLEECCNRLRRRQESYVNVFSENEVRAHFARPEPGVSVLTTLLAPGLMKELFNRLLSLQSIIRMKDYKLTGLTLLQTLQPELAKHYIPLFNSVPVCKGQNNRVGERFARLDRLFAKTATGVKSSQFNATVAASKPLKLSTPLTLKEVLQSYRGENYSIAQAQAELTILVNVNVDAIASDFLHGGSAETLHSFQSLAVRHQLFIFGQFVQALSTAEPPSTAAQDIFLQACVGIPFHSLVLTPFKAVLTDQLLESLLAGAGNHLLTLDISGCRLISENVFTSIAKLCPQLTHLRARHLANLQLGSSIFSGTTLYFPLLEYLEFSDCSLLRQLSLNAPSLKKLTISRCVALIQLTLHTPNLEQFELNQLARLQEFQFSESGLFAKAQLTRLLSATFYDVALVSIFLPTPMLQRLQIENCRQLTRLETHSQQLQTLLLQGCPLFADSELIRIVPSTEYLQKVSIDDCSRITHSNIRSRFPLLLSHSLEMVNDFVNMTKNLPNHEVVYQEDFTLLQRQELRTLLLSKQKYLEMVEQVISALMNAMGHESIRSMDEAHASRALGAIGQARPQYMAQALPEMVWRHWSGVPIAVAFEKIGQMVPEAMIPTLQKILLDENNPSNYWCAIGILREIAQDKPEVVIPLYIIALRAKDPSFRCYVVGSLGKLNGQAKSVAALLVALKDNDLSVRRQAVESLGKIGNAKPLEVMTSLLSAMQDPSNGELLYCIETAMAKIAQEKPNDVMPLLLTALRDKNEYIRAFMANIIGKVGLAKLEEVIPVLLHALHDPYDKVRCNAVEALGHLGQTKHEQVIPVLLVLLQEKYSDIRIFALIALGKIGQANLREVIPALLVQLQHMDSKVRKATAEALGNLAQANPKEIIPALLAALQDQNSQVREAAVKALGKLGQANPKEVIPALLLALQDKDTSVVNEARYALVKLSKTNLKEVISVLFVAVQNISHRCCASQAASALETIGYTNPELVIPAFLVALQHADADARLIAARALGNFGHTNPKEVIPALLAALERSKSPHYQNQIVANANILFALGKIGQANPKAVVPALFTALKSYHLLVRAVTVIALMNFDQLIPEELIPTLLDTLRNKAVDDIDCKENFSMLYNEVNKLIIKIISRAKLDKVLPTLLHALRDNDYDVQNMALMSLTLLVQLKSEEVVPPLLNILRDNNDKIRVLAIKILRNINWTKHKEMITELMTVLKAEEDRHVLEELLITLGKIGQAEPEAVISTLLEIVRNQESDKFFSNYLSSNVVAALGIVCHAQSENFLKKYQIIPTLLEALRDKNYKVRVEATTILGEIVKVKTELAMPSLLVAVKDEKEEVRNAAVIALEKLWLSYAEKIKQLFFQVQPFTKEIEVRPASPRRGHLWDLTRKSFGYDENRYQFWSPAASAAEAQSIEQRLTANKLLSEWHVIAYNAPQPEKFYVQVNNFNPR